MNPHCMDTTIGRLCPSCRYTLKWGLFIGGIIGGIMAAIFK